MFDDQIRRGLHELADEAPTGGDLDAVRGVGLRRRRNRNAGKMAIVALVVGAGFVVPQLLDGTQSMINTNVADDGGELLELDEDEAGYEEGSGTTLTTVLAVEPDQPAEPDQSEENVGSGDQASATGSSSRTSEESGSSSGQQPANDEETDDQETEDQQTGEQSNVDNPAGSNGESGSTSRVEVGAFTCQSYNNGILTWPDHRQNAYRIYRSTNGGSSYTWLGTAPGDLAFTDHDYQAGYVYKVNYDGSRQVPCERTSAFGCQVNSIGTVTWTDQGAGFHQVYRSTDGGASFAELERVQGAAAFTDSGYQTRYRYQISHDGLPSPTPCSDASRFECQISGPGRLIWSDVAQGKYNVHRSTDGGATYTWIGSASGETLFAALDHRPGDRYRVKTTDHPVAPCQTTDALVCQVNSVGTVTWNDGGRDRFRISVSSDGGSTYSEIAQVGAASSYTDKGFQPGRLYRVGHDGLQQPYPCRSDTTFLCLMDAPGRLTWTDRNQETYRVYRSIDGETFSWLDRVDGGNEYVDPDARSSYRYRVNYDDLPDTIVCTSVP